ncbi:MAG: hypothetical protein Q8N15_06040 [Bacillota bacterium]|nr:hypothetical protein [Bacillota bacterium]
MLKEVLLTLKKRNNVIAGVVYFILFSVIYYLLDLLNGGYAAMAETYGSALVVVNLAMNVVMAAGTAFMMTLSTAYVKFSGKEGKGTFLGSAAVFFGILTYGCTSCVISFFAAIGIAFSVAVLPLAGLPYKFISLALVALGLVWLMLEIKRGRCKIRKPAPETPIDN